MEIQPQSYFNQLLFLSFCLQRSKGISCMHLPAEFKKTKTKKLKLGLAGPVGGPHLCRLISSSSFTFSPWLFVVQVWVCETEIPNYVHTDECVCEKKKKKTRAQYRQQRTGCCRNSFKYIVLVCMFFFLVRSPRNLFTPIPYDNLLQRSTYPSSKQLEQQLWILHA